MRARDLVCLGLVAAALLLSVLAVGGALRWVQAAVAALTACAVLVQLWSRRRLDRAPPLVLWLAVAAGLCAVQLLPLPHGVLAAVDATGTQLRDDGAAIAGTSPWQAISLDPAATLRGLAMLATLLGIALLGLRFAVVERGRFLVLGGVAVTCGLAAVVAGVHALLGADRLYGVYAPVHMQAVFGPLLNPNHMGGLMAIGAVLGFGLAFYPNQLAQLRVLWVGVCVTCSAACAATMSRGAMLGLAIGLCVAAAVLVSSRMSSDHRRRRHQTWRRDLPVAMVIGLGVALALYASAGNVAGQLRDTSFTELSKPVSKYAAWKSSLDLVREAPLVGIGRGAVESSLTRVHPASAYFTFSHLENEYLSAVVELGIPGAIVLGGLFLWGALVAFRRWRDGPLAAAALGALAAIGFQSSVDFGVELLGLAVPVVLIACTVQLVPLRPETSGRLGRVRVARALLVGLLAGAALLAVSSATRDVQEDHDALLDQPHATLADVRELVARHPLDYYGFGVGADIASRDDDVRAAAWLNHALALHPTHPGLHRLAARMLVGLRLYPQAAVEYGLALDAQVAPRQLLEEIVLLIPNPTAAAAAIPTDYPNPEAIHHALVEMNRSDIEQGWLARVSELPQHDLRAIDAWIDLANSRGDLGEAERAAQLRLDVAHTTTSRLKLARVQLRRGEYAPLLAELADVREWNGRLDEKGEAWRILCDVHIAQKDWDVALECLHHLDTSGLAAGGHSEIDQRLRDITEQRTVETQMKEVEHLKQELEHHAGSAAGSAR